MFYLQVKVVEEHIAQELRSIVRLFRNPIVLLVGKGVLTLGIPILFIALLLELSALEAKLKFEQELGAGEEKRMRPIIEEIKRVEKENEHLREQNLRLRDDLSQCRANKP